MSSASLPSWDLSGLFSSEKDPGLLRLSKSAIAKAQSFSRRYRNKVSSLARQPKALLAAIKSFEAILQQATKPVLYASLRFAESATAEGRGSFLQAQRSTYVQLEKELLFFELELLKLPQSKLHALAKKKELSNYSHYLEGLAKRAAHVLSEPEERLYADLSLTGRGAFVRLFGEEAAARLFEFAVPGPKAGKEKLQKVPQEKLLESLYSAKRSVRKAAHAALSKGLIADARRQTFIFNILSADKATEDRYRKYETPEAARHLSNEISQEMVDSMSGAVSAAYPLVRRYYTFKRSLLGLKELFDYDRYAPLAENKSTISFAAAQRMILDAFERFSPEYRKIGEEFFSKGWIDAAARPGKRSGAFCSFGTPDHHPYVFVNFSGSYKEAFTLAHELGHAIHARLMQRHSYLNFDVPLTVAETASVFAEMLLFDHLRAELSGQELFSLGLQKIDGIIATVFRQLSMYRFEQDVHAAAKAGKELSTAELNAHWRKRQTELYGNSVTLTKEYDYWWSYIPHFVHTPFYVYAYAFGELLTLALYARYKQGVPGFRKTYIEFLSKGGTQTPEKLVAPFGVTLQDKNFWSGGLGVLEDLIQQVKKLA